MIGKIVKLIFSFRFFPLVTQLVTLFVFVLLIAGGLGVTTSSPEFAKILRNTNLANLIVWSFWWPLIIISAVFFGRLWCTVCPIELVTSVAGKFGFRRKPGKFLKSGWVVTVLYGIILIVGIHTFAIHRIPHRMAIYMLALFLMAAGVGIIWEKRTFCSYVCPVGHLLGLYSLLSFFGWRVDDPQICKNCKTKECISKDRHYNLTARSCTTNLYPPNISDNKSCLLCSQCLSACPHNNPGLKLINPFKGLTKLKLNNSEISMVIVLVGFVVYEILSGHSVSKGILLAVPESLAKILHVGQGWLGPFKAVILFLIFPGLFVFLFGFARKIAAKESVIDSLSITLLSLLPIVAFMHVFKGVSKIISRFHYWSIAINDPSGVDSAKKIIDGQIVINNFSNQKLFSILLLIFSIFIGLAGLFYSYKIIRAKSKTATAFSITLFMVLIYLSIYEIPMITTALKAI